MSMVTSGGRLEKPAGCPDPIYGIMTRCWHPRPEDRPSFATIVERMGYCLQVITYAVNYRYIATNNLHNNDERIMFTFRIQMS